MACLSVQKGKQILTCDFEPGLANRACRSPNDSTENPSLWDVCILIVEDEPTVAEFLDRALIQAGYYVECVPDGKSGLIRALSGDHDLLLLDVMLPAIDGLEICRQVRSAGNAVPIIMLSARGTLNDKVAGLDAGADDYLPKPFQIAELLARVRANLRRPGSVPLRLNVGPITLNPVQRTVTLEAKDIWLSPTEFGLLDELMRNAGRTVTRAVIMRQVWKQDFVGDDKVLDVYISSLRKKLGAAGALIKTDRGVGYRIEAGR